LKSELTDARKLNDDKKRELEKLSNEIAELDNQNVALENANHRAVNETYGIKRETLQMEMNRDNVEKEKNMYAKQASDANMEHIQALEKLKNLNEAINDLKEKNSAAETKLKNQKKIYEALKADSNRFDKKYQEALREIKDIIEDKIKKEGKYNSLKIELEYKQSVISDTEAKLEGFQEAVEKNEKEKKELENSCTNLKLSIEKYVENNINLKKMISTAELDYQNQKKEYNIVVREKDFLQQQLIQRNEEINSLYQKIKVLQQELVKMHQQYENKLLEIEKLKSTRDFLLIEYSKTEDIIKNIFDLKVIKIKLEKEVLMAKNKVRSLEDETKKKLNIHRWTKLEYSDPEKYELISQINSLQRRLIAKTEEVTQKEELIQEKEKLYIKLKGIVARQSGVDMEEPLAKYKQKIKEETGRLKKLKEDIKNYQMDIKNYEYEIKRINSEIENYKNQWYAIQRQTNSEALNMVNEFNYDNTNEENNEVNEDGAFSSNRDEAFEGSIDNVDNAEFLNYYKNKVNSA
jgi:chromosome segregation ATPase